ncbi:MAG TPA: ATP synthase subunit I [Eubacteriaceae bacterium]|jgi:F1F0 ATPase subunit 2|nr:ATP synthase subunit I [Eubacteriaceae bacterium]
MLIAFIVGGLLGFIFFGGLYLSVTMLNKLKYPALFMSASLIIRMVILLAGIYFISSGNGYNMIAALSGVVIVRVAMTNSIKKSIGLSKDNK